MMLSHGLWIATLLLPVLEVFPFSLYPTVDSDRLAGALGITIDCLVALNTTVGCDQDLFQWTNAVDDHLWDADNLTTLCVPSCVTSAQQWNSNVQNVCADDTISIFGTLVPAGTVAGRFSEGLTTACLQSRSILPISFPLNVWLTWDANSASSWCIVESQDWVGSDVVRPDCSQDPTDPSCMDVTNVTAENQRIANLYDDQLLCSECFIKMFHQRLSSAYLPDQDYSDYLVDQYLDIQDICSASTMPELTTRGPFYYATATASANATASATAATASSTGPSPSCLGQIVDTGANVTSSNATEACNQLSLLHGVTTGDLQAISGGDDCYTPEPVCLPAACSLLQVPAGATCDSIAAGLTNNITYVQFLSWNPNIIGLCDLLQEGQYICESAPGGSYIPPPNPTGDTGAGGHERGGPGGADPTAISGTVTTLVTSTPLGQVPTAAPAPTQAGIIPICNSYAKAVGGDYCQKFAQANSITPDQLYAWNNILGSGGSNCSIQFFANYYYCVGVSGGTATSSLPPAPTTTSTTAPSPTQTGIPSYCNKYGQAQPGTSCSAFASSNQVSPNDLYAWNPILGASGTNCNTQLFAGYYYCTGIAVPSPIQAGSAGNCNNYAEAVDGDYCFKFAQDKGITTDQLYTWNTVLGAGGANCGTQFFKGYWYCVGVDG